MNGMVVGIDPGENTGVAWGVGGVLVACALASPGDPLVAPSALEGRTFDVVGRAVIELPKFYPVHVYGSPKKATAIGNSLIRESVTLGRWTERAHMLGFDVEEIYPRTWKGTIPKRAMCKRVVGLLTRDERKLVAALGLPKSTVHNVLDAIGILFWKVGRL